MEDSALTKQTYWDAFYDDELNAFRDGGHKGEEWFQQEVVRITQWIAKSIPTKNRSSFKVMDVGCGNGLFLFRLARLGFKQLAGCDYSPFAIDLAKEICSRAFIECNREEDRESDDSGFSSGDSSKLRKQILPIRLDNVSIKFAVMDIATVEHPISPETTHPPEASTFSKLSSPPPSKQVTIVDWRSFPRFDLIHDKGTFDIFYMKGEVEIYIASLIRHFLHSSTLLFLTSCNATEAELIDAFTGRSFTLEEAATSNAAPSEISSAPVFEFKLLSTLKHRSIVFGGSTGQVVSSVAFQVTRR